MKSKEIRTLFIKLIAFSFFILVQAYGAYFMWYNHPGPLGLNDAGWYISPITFFKENPFFFITGTDLPNEGAFNFNKILFPYTFGILANLIGLSAEQMFEANFYIGLLLMGIVIHKLLKHIDPSPIFVATGLFIFAFYTGSGYYHGFFWVVPSFYAILIFLVLIITLFYSKHKYLYSLPFLLLLLITHSTGVYLILLGLSSLFIIDILSNKKRISFTGPVILILVVIIIFVTGEYLYTIGIFPRSFSSSLSAYGNTANLGDPQQILSEIIDTVTRYHFAKYFYGLFTPLLAYGIYQLIKNKQHNLLALFSIALIGQILLSPITEHSYRFFYPLELLIWIIIAYGTARLLTVLFKKNAVHRSFQHSLLHWSLAIIALLFLYDAIHLKADRDYSFKFYHHRYVDKAAFQTYLSSNPEKKIVIFTDLQDYYKSIEGIRANKNIEIVREKEAPTTPISTPKLIVIGENRKYYDEKRKGFKVMIPDQSRLVINQLDLEPGTYRLQLLDSGIPDPNALHLPLSTSQWKTEETHIEIPEENMYPPVMMPWHMFADTPWPLFKRPNHNTSLRQAKNHTLDITIETFTDKLSLLNCNDTPLYLQGQVIISDKDTGKAIRVLDLDRNEREFLDKNSHLMIGNNQMPLLWTDPQLHSSYRIKPFLLEKSFGDIKAFTPYLDTLQP